MSNFSAFCMRLAPIFDEGCDRKQAIWLYGPRDSGKSQVQAILGRLVGKAFVTLGSAELQTPFWKAALLGKRILALPEATTKFLRTPEFKAITGDLEHRINEKHEKMVQAKLPVLAFFFSNDTPEIPDDDAIVERIIPCLISPVPRDRGALLPESEYQEILCSELPAFIGYCLRKYEPYRGRRIPCDRQQSVGLPKDCESSAIEAFRRLFVADTSAK